MKLVINLKDNKSFTLHINELTEDKQVTLIDELLEEPSGKIEFSVYHFVKWPPHTRIWFFALWQSMATTRVVTVKAKKVVYTKPLDLVLFQLVDDADGEEVSKWVAETATIAAVFPNAERAIWAAAVVQRLQAIGTGGITEHDFQLMVAKAAEKTDSLTSRMRGPNPTMLASDYLERHRLACPTGPLQPSDKVLIYYNGYFFTWDLAWRTIGSEEMRALITRDLQDHSEVDRVTSAIVGNVLENLRGRCVITRGELPPPFYINDFGPPTTITPRKLLVLQNGMIDLETVTAHKDAKLLSHDTRWFGSSVLPFDFDSTAKCPGFKKFLRQVLERKPGGVALHAGDCRREVLQEWFGYSLLCDARYQKFLIMIGEGSNGKGVILNLWTRMLGVKNVAHVSLDQLSERFGLQPLLGKMANICGDLSEIDSAAEGVLKRLTGEDNIMIDRKNLEAVPMVPTVKLVFGTNTLPRFSDKSRGVWRRLMVMPFRVVIAEDDQDELLLNRLSTELAGILLWALQGLQRLLDQGHFTRCVVCAEAQRQHQVDCDPVSQFLDERGVYPPGAKEQRRRIKKDDLYKQYRDWCEETNHRSMSSNRFNRQIGKLSGVDNYRSPNAEPDGRRPYYWIGIGKPIPLPSEFDDEQGDIEQEDEDA